MYHSTAVIIIYWASIFCLISLSNLCEKCFKVKIKRRSMPGEGWRGLLSWDGPAVFCACLWVETVWGSWFFVHTLSGPGDRAFSLWPVGHWVHYCFSPVLSQLCCLELDHLTGSQKDSLLCLSSLSFPPSSSFPSFVSFLPSLILSPSLLFPPSL